MLIVSKKERRTFVYEKNIVAFMLCIIMFITNFTVAMATDLNKDVNDDIIYLYGPSEPVSESISPHVYEVCAGLPYHKMISSGWGTVFKSDGSSYIRMGCAWQCSNCGVVMVTEGDLYYWGMSTIGKYATLHNQEPINNNGCQIYGADYYGYTSNNYLNGYKFFLYTP